MKLVPGFCGLMTEAFKKEREHATHTRHAEPTKKKPVEKKVWGLGFRA